MLRSRVASRPLGGARDDAIPPARAPASLFAASSLTASLFGTPPKETHVVRASSSRRSSSGIGSSALKARRRRSDQFHAAAAVGNRDGTCAAFFSSPRAPVVVPSSSSSSESPAWCPGARAVASPRRLGGLARGAVASQEQVDALLLVRVRVRVALTYRRAEVASFAEARCAASARRRRRPAGLRAGSVDRVESASFFFGQLPASRDPRVGVPHLLLLACASLPPYCRASSFPTSLYISESAFASEPSGSIGAGPVLVARRAERRAARRARPARTRTARRSGPDNRRSATAGRRARRRHERVRRAPRRGRNRDRAGVPRFGSAPRAGKLGRAGLAARGCRRRREIQNAGALVETRERLAPSLAPERRAPTRRGRSVRRPGGRRVGRRAVGRRLDLSARPRASRVARTRRGETRPRRDREDPDEGYRPRGDARQPREPPSLAAAPRSGARRRPPRAPPDPWLLPDA